jgi:tRNA A-37 threonylcarbamoyl transferase component Bud32
MRERSSSKPSPRPRGGNPDSAPSTEKIGKYDIVREMGRGAMGIVYEGTDPYIGRRVAIKTIRFDVLTQPAEQDEAQKRFMREARSAGILSHPNIVTIYDVGEDRGLTYIAMEYIDGESLESMVSGRRHLTLDDIIALIGQLGDALDYAHRNGIVHRDIKPANILVDREGRPRIVDFGIARISSSSLTQTNQVLGTPYYMAPEQIAGKAVDHRADLYALGTILYELLTFEKPFPGDNVTTVIYKIMNEPPPRIRDTAKNLPPGLDFVMAKALAKDPTRRYQSGRELAEDLRNHPLYAGAEAGSAAAEAMGDIPTAAPADISGPPARAGARKPLLFVLGAMMVLIGIVIVVVLVSRKKEPSFAGGGGGPAPVGAVPSGADAAAPTESKPTAPIERETTAAKKEETRVASEGRPLAKETPGSKTSGAAPEPKAGGASAEIAERLQMAKAAFQRSLYLKCIDEARKVLAVDAGNAEAKSYLDMATFKQAPLDLTALLGEYTATLTRAPQRLTDFYAANSAGDLLRTLRADTVELLRDHEQFQISASTPAFNIADAGSGTYKADMLFSEVMTALSRSKKVRVVLYEGKIKWFLEKTDRWRILKIDYITTY